MEFAVAGFCAPPVRAALPAGVPGPPRSAVTGQYLLVMAGPESSRKNLDWWKKQEIEHPKDRVYYAPIYGNPIEDEILVEKLRQFRVKHIVIPVGGGTQEQLGLYLKRELDYPPSIHCIGAAIAFPSGDQVRIPDWGDRFYPGWLFRCFSSPGQFVPRYVSASKLFRLLMQYRSELPVEQ